MRQMTATNRRRRQYFRILHYKPKYFRLHLFFFCFSLRVCVSLNINKRIQHQRRKRSEENLPSASTSLTAATKYYKVGGGRRATSRRNDASDIMTNGEIQIDFFVASFATSQISSKWGFTMSCTL